MISAFFWQNSVSLCPASFWSPKAKLACYFRYILTSYFCILIPDAIRSHHFMANRCGNNETVTDFIFGGSKITADGEFVHEIKRHLLLERKVMINLDSILKSRDIALPTEVHLVKAMAFPVVMYGCEIWTIKKAEH